MKNNAGETAKRIYVKVFGFGNTEIDALTSAFALSNPRSAAYSLWSVDAPQKAQVALIDGESWEASLALANPQNDALKLIWIGDRPPANVWRCFPRPPRWDDVIAALDRHYASGVDRSLPARACALDIDLTAATELAPHSYRVPSTATEQLGATVPAIGHRALVIDADRATRLYWRAKLSVTGRTLIDEAATADGARQLVCFHVYQLVVIDLNLVDVSSWTLIKEIGSSHPPVAHIIVTGDGLSWLDSARARFAGAKSAIRKPFQPGKVNDVLQKL